MESKQLIVNQQANQQQSTKCQKANQQVIRFIPLLHVKRHDGYERINIFCITHSELDNITYRDLDVNKTNDHDVLAAAKKLYMRYCPLFSHMSMFEYIDGNLNFIRFYGDFDHMDTIVEFLTLFEQLQTLRDNGFGRFVISGYQTIEPCKKKFALKYINNTEAKYSNITKRISVHVVFYEIALSRLTMCVLFNTDHNLCLRYNEHHDLEFVNANDSNEILLTGLDKNVYTPFTNHVDKPSEQTLRLPISDKIYSADDPDNKFNHGNILDDELEDITYMQCTSNLAITPNGTERVLKLRDLKEIGLYKSDCATPTQQTSTTAQSTAQAVSVDISLSKSDNTLTDVNADTNCDVDTEALTLFKSIVNHPANFNPFHVDPPRPTDINKVLGNSSRLTKLLNVILPECHTKDGDKDMALANNVVGILSSCAPGLFDHDELNQSIYHWWNTDKDGNEWKHHEDNYPCELLNRYYLGQQVNFKYEYLADDDTQTLWAYSLIKHCVHDKAKQKELKQYVKQAVVNFMRIDGSYHDLDTIIHTTLKELQQLPTNYDKLNAIAHSVRYYVAENDASFVSYINDVGYYVYKYDEAQFKQIILACVFNKSADISKAITEIKHRCVLYNHSRLTIHDIYKYDPLNVVEVPAEHSTQDVVSKHVQAYCNRLLDGACNNDQTAFEYLIKRQAWIVQHVMEPSEIIEVAIGKQKTGKSFDSEMFGLVLDTRHTVNVLSKNDVGNTNTDFINVAAKLDDVIGKFTSQTGKARFININELARVENNDRDAHKDYQNLKATTDAQRRIEPKGKQAYTVQNTLNINFTSNNTRCICPDVFETRFFVHCSNPQHDKSEHETYWKQLRTTYSEPYFFKHIYDYLLNMDLTTFDISDVPITAAYVHILFNNSPSLDKFVLNNFEQLSRGITKQEFITLVQQNNALGSYKHVDSMFDDYVAKFSCTYRDVKLIASKTSYKLVRIYNMDASVKAQIMNIVKLHDTNFTQDNELIDVDNANEISNKIKDVIATLKTNNKSITIKGIDKYYLTVDDVNALAVSVDITFVEQVINNIGYVKQRIRVNGQRPWAYVVNQNTFNNITINDIIQNITGIDLNEGPCELYTSDDEQAIFKLDHRTT